MSARCLYCGRFARRGVTRCARCDARAMALSASVLAAMPSVRTVDDRGCAPFAAASDAYVRVRACAFGSLVIAVLAFIACR